MVRAAPSPCTVPGCPDLSYRMGRCPAHEAAADARKGTNASRGYDAAWRRARAAKLRRTPFCEKAGCHTRADQVDHIDGNATGPRRLDPTNHRSLCALHHRQRTAADQPGGVRLS